MALAIDKSVIVVLALESALWGIPCPYESMETYTYSQEFRLLVDDVRDDLVLDMSWTLASGDQPLEYRKIVYASHR
jgi:hypothetical protein